MARQILIYVVSAALVPVVRITKGIILLVLPVALIRERLGTATHAVLSVLLNVALVCVSNLLSGVFRVEFVFYMLIPAVFFTMLRSRIQRSRFRSGSSLEESLHKNIVRFQGGQPGSDYRELLIHREYVNEVAALMGFVAGGFLFLGLK